MRPFLVGGAGPFVVVDVEDAEGGFEDKVGELKEPVKLRLRESWEEVVDDEEVPPAIPDEEDDLEGAGVRLGS